MSVLCIRKDYEIQNMQDKMSCEDFVLWREKLEEALEFTPQWTGVTDVLEKVRKASPSEASYEKVLEYGGRGRMYADEVQRQGCQLYTLLKVKLDTTGNSLCSDMSERNGYEMYRRLSANYDPAAEGTDMALLDQLMGMAKSSTRTSRRHMPQARSSIYSWMSTTSSRRAVRLTIATRTGLDGTCWIGPPRIEQRHVLT